mgnify:CR=1 FL=1
MFGAYIRIDNPRVLSGADAQVERFVTDAVAEVGYQALADVHRILDQSIKRPTPYYETQITIDRQRHDRVIVHDRGVVYGPWLEGVSSRNLSTKFKGYHSFRRAANGLVDKVEDLIKPHLVRLLARLK